MAWGVEVTTVDLPSVNEGAEFFASSVVRQMPAGEPPVVVAHSSAGLILPVVPEFMEVARLVYLAAVIPKPQTSLGAQFNEWNEMFQPNWLGKDPVRNPAVARDFLFHDCEPRIQDWALTTLRLWYSTVLIREECPLGHLPTGIPTTYVSAALDRTLNEPWWEKRAEWLGMNVVRMQTGHSPHVSRPREVASVIKGKALHFSRAV